MKKIAKLKKENFIRITPVQYIELMQYCMYFKKIKNETNPIHHDASTLVMAEIYEAMDKKSGFWKYYPPAVYRAFKLRYSEYYILATELMNHCPSYALYDVLGRLDTMFLNYYDFSLNQK